MRGASNEGPSVGVSSAHHCHPEERMPSATYPHLSQPWMSSVGVSKPPPSGQPVPSPSADPPEMAVQGTWLLSAPSGCDPLLPPPPAVTLLCLAQPP